MDSGLGQLIAERFFEVGDGEPESAGFRIGRPKRNDDADFECRAEIFGFGPVQQVQVFAIDDVQALCLILVRLRQEVRCLPGAVWLGESAYLGLPVIVPKFMPEEYVQRVEAIVERVVADFAQDGMLKTQESTND